MRPPHASRMLGAATVLAALAVPALLAVQMVRAAGAPGQQLDAGLFPGGLTLAQAGGAGSPGGDDTLVLGVLYTRGQANVTWNGATFPVTDGSYAYVGGETIRVLPGAMGLLRLPGGGNVFVCGGATARLDRGPGAGYRLDVFSGSTRFVLPAEVGFTVNAGAATVRSSSRDPAAGVVNAEVQARDDGGTVVYELRGGVQVAAGGTLETPEGAPGRVVDVTAQGAISSEPIAPQVLQAALAGAQDSAAGAFLCQGEALRRKPEEKTPQTVATKAQEPETAAGPSAESAPESAPTPPPGETPAPADAVPPVAPPDAPPVALAEPTPPDPFDPNVLPPPSAGEPAEPVVVVAPPAVPRFGSGGGGAASPS